MHLFVEVRIDYDDDSEIVAFVDCGYMHLSSVVRIDYNDDIVRLLQMLMMVTRICLWW